MATVSDHGKAEHWPEQRAEHRSRKAAEAEQRSVEKCADAIASAAADEEVRKAKIRAKLWEIAEDWLCNKQDRLMPADYRRIAQTCMEMGVFEGTGHDGDGQGVILMPEVEGVVEQ